MPLYFLKTRSRVILSHRPGGTHILPTMCAAIWGMASGTRNTYPKIRVSRPDHEIRTITQLRHLHKINITIKTGDTMPRMHRAILNIGIPTKLHQHRGSYYAVLINIHTYFQYTFYPSNSFTLLRRHCSLYFSFFTKFIHLYTYNYQKKNYCQIQMGYFYNVDEELVRYE